MTVQTLAERSPVSPALASEEAAYAKLVAAGREVVNQTGWMLGDLANKVESRYGESRLEQFAGDIGVPANTMKRYRTVARAFPETERRPSISFGVAQALASQPDRFELAAQEPSVREARALVNARRKQEPARTPGWLLNPNGPPTMPEQQGEGDDEVIREIKRQLRHVNDVMSPERCDALATVLDRAASRARSKARALRLEVE